MKFKNSKNTLENLKMVCEATTEGPWDCSDFNDGLGSVYIGNIPLGCADELLVEDAVFIATAHEVMPELIEKIEELEKSKAVLTEKVDEIRGLIAKFEKKVREAESEVEQLRTDAFGKSIELAKVANLPGVGAPENRRLISQDEESGVSYQVKKRLEELEAEVKLYKEGYLDEGVHQLLKESSQMLERVSDNLEKYAIYSGDESADVQALINRNAYLEKAAITARADLKIEDKTNQQDMEDGRIRSQITLDQNKFFEEEKDQS